MLGGGASLSYNKCTVQFGEKKESRRVAGAGARDFIWAVQQLPLHKTRLPTAGSDWWPKRRGTSSWFFRVGWLGRDDIHHHHSKSVTRKRERPRPRPPRPDPNLPSAPSSVTAATMLRHTLARSAWRAGRQAGVATRSFSATAQRPAEVELTIGGLAAPCCRWHATSC